MLKASTWLPVFPGFYNTIFEPDEDREILNINERREEKGLPGITSDDCEWDYQEYMQEISRACVDFLNKELKERGFITDMIFEELRSPREYNFDNDTIDVKITLTASNIKNLWDYLKEHRADFKKYLLDRYSSYSGFVPFHSNDIDDWFSEEYDIMCHQHRTGSVLNFICENEGITEEDMHIYCTDRGIYLCATNYDILVGDIT